LAPPVPGSFSPGQFCSEEFERLGADWQLDTWEDKQTGQKRSTLRAVGENMQLSDSKEDAGSPDLPSLRTLAAGEKVGTLCRERIGTR
jgi:hypothetical protein